MSRDVLSLLRPKEVRAPGEKFTALPDLLAPEVQPPKPADPIGGELRNLIDALTRLSREVESISDEAAAAQMRESMAHIHAISCRVAVVGQVKAGKSSFLNAVMQRGDLLPTHVNPWTAVATRLHFGTPGKPIAGSDFTFFTAEEWSALRLLAGEEAGAELTDAFDEMKRRAEVRLGDKFYHLLGKTHHYQSVQPSVLENYLCAGPPVQEVSREVKPGRYADITKSANAYFTLSPFALPAILIDTPGTNDPTHLRLRITREIIEGADIYIVVLTAKQPLASADLSLLKLIRGLEKKRIVVFINRIDELGETERVSAVIKHVTDELHDVFGDTSIPVLAGSAKWAGLATSNDAQKLKDEALSPAFAGVADQRSLSIPLQDGPGGDLRRLQNCLHIVSGLEAVERLLTLFMLSGFMVNHARGIADVLLSACETAGNNALKTLHAIATQALDRSKATAAAEGQPNFDAGFAKVTGILDALETLIREGHENARKATDVGIAALQSALERDIRYSMRSAPSESTASGWGGLWNKGRRLGRSGQAGTPQVSEAGSDWLTSSKEAVLDLLRKAFPDGQAETAVNPPEPTDTRRLSLAVPVTASKEVSMDTGAAWWSQWLGNVRYDSGKEEDRGHSPKQDFAQRRRVGSDGFINLVKDERVARSLTSIGPLQKLFETLRSMTTASNNRFLDAIPEADLMLNDACYAIALQEQLTNELKALFSPPIHLAGYSA